MGSVLFQSVRVTGCVSLACLNNVTTILKLRMGTAANFLNQYNRIQTRGKLIGKDCQI
jgi:hypothetical protein